MNDRSNARHDSPRHPRQASGAGPESERPSGPASDLEAAAFGGEHTAALDLCRTVIDRHASGQLVVRSWSPAEIGISGTLPAATWEAVRDALAGCGLPRGVTLTAIELLDTEGQAIVIDEL